MPRNPQAMLRNPTNHAAVAPAVVRDLRLIDLADKAVASEAPSITLGKANGFIGEGMVVFGSGVLLRLVEVSWEKCECR